MDGPVSSELSRLLSLADKIDRLSERLRGHEPDDSFYLEPQNGDKFCNRCNTSNCEGHEDEYPEEWDE